MTNPLGGGGSHSYRLRIVQIQQGFVMGVVDRETSLTMFEDLLHEYGLLPVEEHLDRTITNENFVQLLKIAHQQRDLRSSRDPEISKDINYNEHALAQQQDLPQYRLADSILQHCPICKVKVSGLYNRMQSADNQTVPVDPPRCKACMMKWIEEKFGTGIGNSVGTPYPTVVSVDSSEIKPLDAAEIDFFAQYEAEMKDFKP